MGAVLTGGVEELEGPEGRPSLHDLTCEQARWVDAVTLEAVLGLPFGRALAVVEGKVVAADPTGHDTRRQARESQRFVRASRSDTAGMRMLHARTTAGDVARLDAIVAHLADLLHTAGDTHDRNHRRATALGLLANPALACVYLAGGLPQASTPATEAAATPAPTETLHPFDDEPDEGGLASPVAAARVLGDALKSLGATTVDRLRPRTVLYLHLAEEALATPEGCGAHVVRSEGLGAVTRTQLTEWLGNGLGNGLARTRSWSNP